MQPVPCVCGRNTRDPKLRERGAVEEQVDDVVAVGVPACHDDRRRAHRVNANGGRSRVFDRTRMALPLRTSASGMFGVTTLAQRQRAQRRARARRLRRAAVRRSWTR